MIYLNPNWISSGWNKRLWFSLLIAILLLVFVVVPVLADAPGTGVVVEGVSVPGIELGFSRSQVESAYGDPAFCQNVSGYDQGSCQFDVEGGGQMSVRYRGADGGPASNSPEDVVYFIRWFQQVTGWTTTAGVNTTLAYNDPDAVMAVYPNATVSYQSMFDWSLDDPELGIHIYYHTSYLTGALSVSMGISFPASPPPEPEEHFVRVTDIDLSVAKRGEVSASVRVQDDLDRNAYGAIVFATWTMPDGSQISFNGVTDSFGTVMFDLGKLKRRGTYTFKIEDVDINGFHFDAGNSVLNASVSK